MSPPKKNKHIIDLLGRACAYLMFRFDFESNGGKIMQIDTATATELQKIVKAEGLSVSGDQALVRAVVRLYSGYKKRCEKAVMQGNERLERIRLISNAYQRIRNAQPSDSKILNDKSKKISSRKMEPCSLTFRELGSRIGQILAKGIWGIENAKLSNLKKLVEDEGLPASADNTQLVRAVAQLYSGYKESYEKAVMQSNERLARIELLSKAHENLCRNASFTPRAPNRKLAVLHVPKTGGTSLHKELKTCFPDAAFLDAGHTSLERAEAGELDVFDIIFGHMYLENLAKHSTGRYKAFFLRDPVTQAASIWGFMRSFVKDPVLSTRPDIVAACQCDFDTYIQSSDPNAYNTKRNRFARILLGEKFKDRDLDSATAEMIQQKLKEIDFVGLFEYYSEDSQELLKILGAKPSAQPVWLNKTSERMPRESISQETCHRILQKSSLDAEIYRLALLRRRERLEKNGRAPHNISQGNNVFRTAST